MMRQSFPCENRDVWIFENVETALPSVDDKSFHSDAEIAVKEVFDVGTTTPGVVTADVAIVFTQNRASLGRALPTSTKFRLRS